MKSNTKKKVIDFSLPGVIGQEPAKREIAMRLETYAGSGYFPNYFIGGNAGDGKTFITKHIARALHKIAVAKDFICPKENVAQRPLIKVNCSSIKSLKEFFENLIMQQVEGRQVTVHFDECQDLSPKITTALLTILEPTPERKTSYTYFDYNFEFDFKYQNFIFTTTEEQKVFPPLMKRLRRIDLLEYTPKELAEIVKLGCEGVNFKDEALETLVSFIRQEGRAAHIIGDEIREYSELKGKKDISPRDVTAMKEALSWMPYGITAAELNIMRIIKEYPEGASVTSIANRVNKGMQTVRAMERYLVRTGMISVDGLRTLTHRGHEFVDSMKGKTVAEKAPAKKSKKK